MIRKNKLSILAIILIVISMALTANAAGIGKILNNPVFQAVDSDGIPISGGLVYGYEPGTTTPKDTYSDRGCTTPNTAPVVLDANGQAIIYLQGATKINLKTSEGVQQDNFPIDYLQGFDETTFNELYPDYNATDQGVTGDNNTIKYYIDQAAGNAMTIHLLHDSGGATTPYIVGTDLIESSNITFKIDRGALISVSTAKNLIINGDVEAGDYQIFDGAGDIDFSAGMEILVSWCGGLPEALVWIESEEISLKTTQNITLATAKNIPDNVTLKINHGATIDGAATLTIYGPLEAGLYQIFGDSIDIAGMRIVHPEWWGIDGSADSVQIQSAIDSISTVGEIHLNPGVTYIMDTGLTGLSPDKIIYGHGAILDFSTATIGSGLIGIDIEPPAYNLSATVLRDLWIKGNAVLSLGNYTSNFTGIGISTSKVTLDNVTITGCDAPIHYGDNSFIIRCVRSIIRFNNYGIKYIQAANSGEQLVYQECSISNNNIGIYNDLANLLISDSSLDYNAVQMSYNRTSISGTHSQKLIIDNCHIENSDANATGVQFVNNGILIFKNPIYTSGGSGLTELMFSNESNGYIHLYSPLFVGIAQNDYCVAGSSTGRISLSNVISSLASRVIRIDREHSMVPDNGFESGSWAPPTGWNTTAGNPTVTGTDHYAGAYSLELIVESPKAVAITDLLPIKAGATEIFFTAWAKNNNDTNICYLAIIFYNQAGAQVGSAANVSVATGTTSWGIVQASPVVPISACYYAIRVTGPESGVGVFRTDEAYVMFNN